MFPGTKDVLEWTQDWIQTLNKNEEDQAPTFKVESPPPGQKRGSENLSSAGKSILRNGYQKKRTVSWSKTIQVETFLKDESRDDNSSAAFSESESEDSYDYDEPNMSRSTSAEGDEAQSRDIDSGYDVAGAKQPDTVGEDAADNKATETTGVLADESTPTETPELPFANSDESEDVFAHIDVSFSEHEENKSSNNEEVDVESTTSTITEGTMEGKKEEKKTSQEKVKPSSIFEPVLLPANFRLENRLERTHSGSFCTLSEDDRSLISNMNDTVSLNPRRAASDEESIVSLKKRKVAYYDDTNQRMVDRALDGVLGHLGINLPVPSMQNFWSALGVSEVGTSEVSAIKRKDGNARQYGEEIHCRLPKAESEDDLIADKYTSFGDDSDAISEMATLSKEESVSSIGVSQAELSAAWQSKTAAKKKKSRFGRFTLSRRKKKADIEEPPTSSVPTPKKRGLFTKRRNKSKPQLMC
eukprot:scaffold2314_cov139-Skeletonema_menzelii.AAC.3